MLRELLDERGLEMEIFSSTKYKFATSFIYKTEISKKLKIVTTEITN